MPTSAARNENRLTDDDRKRMTETVALAMYGWGPTYVPNLSVDLLALTRVAAHSIGCSQDDLRDSELDEIATMVRTTLTDARTARGVTE